MAEREIVIARRSGALRGPNGERIVIKQGRTAADAEHPAVLAHPRAWAPLTVALRVDGDEVPDADSWDPAGGTGADPETAATAEQFGRLASAARGLGVLPDEPLTAAEVVEHLVAILDEWKSRPGGMHEEIAAEADARAADRETIRAWAKAEGMQVADNGRLSKAVEDAYHAAHGG